jgi:hypothetical protein
MNLEDHIMKVIDHRWYVKENPEVFLSNRDILLRGKTSKRSAESMA